VGKYFSTGKFSSRITFTCTHTQPLFDNIQHHITLHNTQQTGFTQFSAMLPNQHFTGRHKS